MDRVLNNWKPEKRLAIEKKEARSQRKRSRASVRAEVWRRDKGLCQRCGKKCVPPKETYPTDPDRGEVNEPGVVALGANPLNPDECELICHGCHFGGPSGAHAPKAARMKKKGGDDGEEPSNGERGRAEDCRSGQEPLAAAGEASGQGRRSRGPRQGDRGGEGGSQRARGDATG